MSKKISCLLASLMLVSSFSMPVLAKENMSGNLAKGGIITDSVVIDKGDTSNGDTNFLPKEELENLSKDKLGSIEIRLPDTKKNLPKDGVKFAFTKVADVVDGSYVMNIKDTGVDLNNIKNANELELAANKLSKLVGPDEVKVTNELGICSLKNLEVGVYLVYAQDINKYENITPFLVAIPTWNTEEKDMLYDINVIPKHSPLPEKDKNTAPDTSTGNNSILYGAISLGCLALAGGMLVLRKRKTKEVK